MRSSSGGGGGGGGAFHLHLPHLILRGSGSGSGSSKTSTMMGPTTPKGCMVVRVGREEEEEPQRFVVPVVYLNHPLFAWLLKEAEEEYGFHQEGAITIPCHVDYFRQVRGMIDKDTTVGGGGCHGHHNHHHLLPPLLHLHLHLHLSGCFRA